MISFKTFLVSGLIVSFSFALEGAFFSLRGISASFPSKFVFLTAVFFAFGAFFFFGNSSV
jgi:hypothetical protein